MNIRIGHIPYLNMVPFYHGFGPDLIDTGSDRFEFWDRSPRALGIEAESGLIDAAPLSLVDAVRLQSHYEPIGDFGIGVKRCAQSVYLFSRVSIPLLQNADILVTDETSTSSILLKMLLDEKYRLPGTRYRRIASASLWDGQADAMLLIGDEALRVARKTVPGLPVVTDLGEEWFRWHGLPFVFARWMVRRSLEETVKATLHTYIEKALISNEFNRSGFAYAESLKRGFSPMDIKNYWDGFYYRLTPSHERSIEIFNRRAQSLCLTV